MTDTQEYWEPPEGKPAGDFVVVEPGVEFHSKPAYSRPPKPGARGQWQPCPTCNGHGMLWDDGTPVRTSG